MAASLTAEKNELAQIEKPVEAKTGRTGFLHLSNEIRNEIFRLAISDHDRGTVFLPRKLPRKVNPDGERVLHFLFDHMQEEGHDGNDGAEAFANAGLSSDSFYDGCRWVDRFLVLDEENSSLQSDDTKDENSAATSSPDGPVQPYFLARSFVADHEESLKASEAACQQYELEHPEYGEMNEEEDDTGYSAFRGGPYLPSAYDSEDEESALGDGGFREPPEECLNGECENADCEFCAGHGLGDDEDWSHYVDEPVDSLFDGDHPLADDFENFDGAEEIGMLFSENQPGILSACKEIRGQCLPIYYGCNSFSWRFDSLALDTSMSKFAAWTHSVGEHAKHIKQLSFEGRHQVEEGIEFEMDIDLLEVSPFFDIQTDFHYPVEFFTKEVSKLIETVLGLKLRRMSKRNGGTITFSSDDLRALGIEFVKAMTLDPAKL